MLRLPDLSCSHRALNSDIDIKILFSKADSPAKKQLRTRRSNFGRTTKSKHAKSGVCSRRINFEKSIFISMSELSLGEITTRRSHDILPVSPTYRGTSLTRKRTPLGLYRRPMPRVLGGWVFSHGRGIPAGSCSKSSPRSM